MILCYPVIALGEPYTHKGSQNNLIGKDAPAELVKSLSNEKQVTPDTPPTFLFHTDEDKTVRWKTASSFILHCTRPKCRPNCTSIKKAGTAKAWHKKYPVLLTGRKIAKTGCATKNYWINSIKYRPRRSASSGGDGPGGGTRTGKCLATFPGTGGRCGWES